MKINKKFLFILLPVLCGTMLVDLLTKHYICATTSVSGGYSVIPGLFNFTYVENLGAAWSIFSGDRAFLIAISVLFILLLCGFYFLERKQGVLFQVGCGLIFGGAIGNIVDRISLGYVRDFIQFDFWKSFPVFNFADVALCIGVAIVLLHFIISLFREKKCKKN